MPTRPGHAFRHWLVFFSALALAGLAVAACLVVRGAGTSLRLAEARLDADIVVLPAGAAERVEAALLVGGPVYATMPDGNLQRIASLASVAAISPQLYLFCPAQDGAPALLMVACDPARDAALRPWLSGPAPGSLALGSAVGGSAVAPDGGEDVLRLYGGELRLVGTLPPTGTNLDRSVFVSLETAHQVARQSYALAPRPLEIPLVGISAVLVRLRPASDAAATAREIEQAVPGVSAVLRANLFAGLRSRALGLGLQALVGLMVAAAVLATLLSSAFAQAARARSTRALAAEVLALGATGAAVGVALAAPAAYLLRDALVAALALPVRLPSLASLIALSTGSLACTPVALAAMGRLRAERPGLPAARPGTGPSSG